MLVQINDNVEVLLCISKYKDGYSTALTKNSELSDIQLKRISNKISPMMYQICEILKKEYEV